MPAIKITLNRLIELFGKSVNTAELPESVRALAARLMTLTAHTMRIDQKIDARIKALSEQIATLTEIVQTLMPQQEAPAPVTAAPADAAPAPTAAPADEAKGVDEDEEDEAAFFARAQQEAEAEVAAINAAAPVAEVTPLPARKARSAK